MTRTEREVVERLGTPGLTRVLGDVLDQPRLVRLANAVGLSYPGMRAQSQKKPRLVTDLAERASREEAAGRAVVRMLRKETGSAAREWSALAADARPAFLRDAGGSRNGRLGLYLFVAASSPAEPAVDEALASILASVTPPEPPTDGDEARGASEPPEKEAQRLRKRIGELQKKVRYLEGQIAKTKDVEKVYKRDLIQRKGELAEARMLAERLKREVDELRGVKAVASPARAPEGTAAGVEEIERTLKRLLTDQRRIAHRIDTIADAPAPEPTLSPQALEELGTSVVELQKEVAALRRERRKDHQDHAKRLDGLASGIEAARAAVEASPKASRSAARKKGEPERVGVFIDVQNMYYAARQLKGKLDFDALLQASVLDRRLIQATAYVVESKEIDQSGFIAMLQQRAIEVRRKTLKVRSDGSMKGDWDMEMALDILDMAPKLDVVVLVSGDGDFTSLVKRVKSMGPRVEVVAFPRNTAKSLLEAADRFHALDRRAMIRTAEAPPVDAAETEPA
ncbi:MAG TPA: NYN domain-containing protein [Candidatus Polarisedimenticolaceae bacterium]|nr:NYN domain-containing protein [Candidatus Polarisedimenticolaceae bacterium]